MGSLSQKDPEEVVVGGNHYWIRPFSAMLAANISGDVMKLIVPLLGGLGGMLGGSGDVLETQLQDALPSITASFSTLDGDEIERLMKKLLIQHGNIAVDYDGKTQVMTEDILGDMVCGNVQDMYVLAYHVCRINFSGFFAKLGLQSGSATGLLSKQKD